VALCLLTVVGTSLMTAELGMSDTLGAFIAGVLLSETSFRTQVCLWVSGLVCLWCLDLGLGVYEVWVWGRPLWC
jgi:hypothetical protein